MATQNDLQPSSTYIFLQNDENLIQQLNPKKPKQTHSTSKHAKSKIKTAKQKIKSVSVQKQRKK